MVNEAIYLVVMSKMLFIIVLTIVTSYMDLRKREIPLKVWALSLPLAIFLTIIEYTNSYYVDTRSIYIYIIGLFFSIGLSVLFYLFDFFGGADMFAFITLSIIFPINFVKEYIIPPQLLLILYASVTGLFFSLVYFLFNIINRNWRKLPRNIGLMRKIMLMFLGVPVKSKNYIKMKFYYPLTVYNCEKEPEIRYSFSIEEEYEDSIKYIKELIEKKCISGETYLWVTYGIPFLINIYVGFILTLLVKDSWLVHLIK